MKNDATEESIRRWQEHEKLIPEYNKISQQFVDRCTSFDRNDEMYYTHIQLSIYWAQDEFWKLHLSQEEALKKLNSIV